MDSIITIRYKKNFRYYAQMVGYILFILFFVCAGIYGSDIGKVCAFFVVIILMINGVYTFYLILSFKEITITKNEIVINGTSYNPNHIDMKYYYSPRGNIRYFNIYYSGTMICKFIHESIPMGNITGTNHDKIIEVLQKIKNGIDIVGPIDHSIKEIKTDKIIMALPVIFSLIIILLSLILWEFVF